MEPLQEPLPLPSIDDSGSSPGKLADLGILLVHGIGEQAQGETLTRFAEPIIEWVRDWLHRESPGGASVASAPVNASLRAPLLASGVPANTRVLIGTERSAADRADLHAEEWLFAEAWWGSQVLPPPIAAFTGWLLTRGSWLLLFHFNQGLLSGHRPTWLRVLLGVPRVSGRRPWLRLEMDVPAASDLPRWLKWIVGVLITLVWLPLSLLVNAVLIAASLVALIPIGKVRAVVYGVLRSLTGVVGDAYVQIRNPVQRTAFEEATLHAMQWLRPRCTRLAVIAHSQGAAVAHATLQRGDAPDADLLVTVGAGITKLEALRYFERLNASDRVAALLAPPCLLLAAWVWLRARQLGVGDVDAAVSAPIALAIVGASMLAAAWISTRGALVHLRQRSARLSLAARQPAMRWCDVVATHDPVPAGNLTRFFHLEEIEAVTIPVLRSAFNDHNQYWAARASFLPVLVGELGRCTKERMLALDAQNGRFAAARKQHDGDLRVLRTIKFLDYSALLLPCVLALDHLLANVDSLRKLVVKGSGTGRAAAPLAFIDEAMDRIENALLWTVDVIGTGPAPWARSVVNGLVAAVALFVVLLLWQRVVFALWQTWSGNRHEELLRRPVPAPQTTLKERLLQFVGAALPDGLFTAVFMLPFITSLTWTLRPGWLDEARAYQIIGAFAGWIFAIGMALVLLSDVAEKLDEARAWLRQAGKKGTPLDWPRLRELARKLIASLFAASVVWLALGAFHKLPERLELDGIVLGILAFLWGLVELLDRIWRLLDAAAANVLLKRALLGLPLVVGGTIMVLLRLWTNQPSAGGIASSAALVAVASAGILLQGLKWLQRRHLWLFVQRPATNRF